jgi:hypothetical protein
VNAEIHPIMKEIYVYLAKILILLGMIVFSLMFLIISIWPLIDARTRLADKKAIILLGLIQNPAAPDKKIYFISKDKIYVKTYFNKNIEPISYEVFVNLFIRQHLAIKY